MSEKWRNLWLLTVGELLAMALWFSASAVVPQLTEEWQLSGGQQSWLTMSVQAGFVIGAVISAAVNLADRIRPQYLVAISTLAGQRGYDVCVNYTAAADRAESVASQIRLGGRRAITVQADVSQPADIERLFQTIDRELGTLDR